MLLDIYILSFNRPHYLEKLLQSLKSQRIGSFSINRIYLLQDNASDSLSPDKFANTTMAVDECVKLFRLYFPAETVMLASKNLGITGNIQREFSLMGLSQADAFVSVEDDLVLSPLYLEIICQLLRKTENNPYVGVVTAQGCKYPAEAQISAARAVLPIAHKCSFAIPRTKIDNLLLFFEKYFEICKLVEFRDNGTTTTTQVELVNRYFNFLGFPIRRIAIGHDGALDVYSYIYSVQHLTTAATYAIHIGEVGVHLTEDTFKAMGFDKESLIAVNDPPDLAVPDVNAVLNLIRDRRERILRERQNDFANFQH